MKPSVNIMWFRRDLRLYDNAALYHALSSSRPVVPVFIFDRNILDTLDDKHDRRVHFIYDTIVQMQSQLIEAGSSMEMYYGWPADIFKHLIQKYDIQNVFTNHDYELYGIKRDAEIKQLLNESGISFHTFKDQVIFEKDEILKADGSPYTVFTPFSKRWKELLEDKHLSPFHSEKCFNNFYKQPAMELPSIQSIGFNYTQAIFPLNKINDDVITDYARLRDYPALSGTTQLSVHLRFGTISIRQIAAKAKLLNESFLNELIWRDFYHYILWHFPHVNEGKSFKQQYDLVKWENNESYFEKWCEGKTGYPIVDAGMRQLNSTGYMHNRVRMITASFLTKHLLIDWRKGEAYFANKLLDFDFAANNGGWQWAAGCGCDAAPYFRIFNPSLQSLKFDKENTYINKWVPELNSFDYPSPIVNHNDARKKVLEVYNKALKNL